MPKTLFGTYTISGYTLSGASLGVLNPVTVTGSIDIGTGTIPAALYGQAASGPWIVTNLGVITGGDVAAIGLASGATVVNGASAVLSGHVGIAIQNAAGNVTNLGNIVANAAGTASAASQAIGVVLKSGGEVTNQGTGQITGQGWGVAIYGGVGTVVNGGSIGGTAQDGVYLNSGMVTNQSLATISGGWGIWVKTEGSVLNAGSISGTGQGGVLLGGGAVTNQGSIGGAFGIAIEGGAGTVINSGVLHGTAQSGVYMTGTAGGSVTNGAGGQIGGASGVVIRDEAGTVVNSGSIDASSTAGQAVYLAPGFTNRLVDNPGAVFTGAVEGGNAAGSPFVSTLELGAASRSGTLTGLATNFTDFGDVLIDPGATWLLDGANTIVSGATLSDQGTLLLNAATLVADGTETIAAAAGAAASVTVAGGGVWSGTSSLVDGGAGSGSFLVSSEGSVAAAAVVLGAAAGGTGTFDIDGAGSGLAAAASLTVGQAGNGRLTVENQASAQLGGTDIGGAAGGSGVVDVTGARSVFANTGKFVVGDAGLGDLSIGAGGTVTTSAGAVIANTGSASNSSVDVTGSGSDWRIGGTLVVGDAGEGSLSLSQGATVSAVSADEAAAATGDGVITVAGTGSALILSGSLTIGDQAAGELSVLSGATVSALDVTVGNTSAASSGDVDIEGAGSELQVGAGGILNIGVASGGSGVLTLGTGATLNFAGTIVEAGHASFNNNGGAVDPDAVQFTSSSNGGTGLNQYDVYVENLGAVQVAAGTGTWDTPMVLTGTSLSDAANNINDNGDTGQWQLSQSGTLIINANTVDSGQAIVFEDATDTLVIGQVVDGGAAGVSGETPAVVADAENLLRAGGFAAAIWGYQTGDQILFDNMIVASDSIVGGNTLELFESGNDPLGSLTFFNKAGNKALSATGMQAAAAQIAPPVACFAAGTLIDTVRGPVAVENLRPGDEAITRFGLGRVVWIGTRTVNCGSHPRPEMVWPVRIMPGAFGPGIPGRALHLSPDHAVFVNGVLVPVRLLVNGSGIAQVRWDRVSYFHVELPEHSVILAEGLTVESYLDTGDRMDFHQGGAAIRLFADFAARPAPNTPSIWETRAAAPLVIAGEALATARTLVAANPDRMRSSVEKSVCRSP